MMNNKATPFSTPSRRKASGSYAHQTPPSVRPLFTTPSRKSSRSAKKSSRVIHATSHTRPLTTSSPSYGDRFIPNRANMKVDLIRSSLYKAEKRRLESIGKAVARQRRKLIEGDDATSSSSPTTITPQVQLETPLQTEFRRRFKGALLDIPLEELVGSSIPATDMLGRRRGVADEPRRTSSLEFHSDRKPHDMSYLAYASLEELEELEAEDQSTTPSRRVRECEPRFLSFANDENRASSSSGSNHYSSGSLPPMVDPFVQDQLRVLQRSAMNSSFGRMLSINGEDLDPSGRGLLSGIGKVSRRIPTAPSRVLDAPDFLDDYYLNLISWSRDNVLAVALGKCVYLWNASTGAIHHLVTLPGADDYVSSVSWAATPGHSKYLAVGTNSSMVQLWDTESLRRVRALGGHSSRVGSLTWNQQWLTSGSRDSLIYQHDVRAADHIVAAYKGHEQEVCGLKWNEDGSTLASGGNENYLCLWDAAMSQQRSSARSNQSTSMHAPRVLLSDHKAAVKALAWCPFKRELLCSGGGTADKTIKFWNTQNGSLLNSIDTGSQVCSLIWSNHHKELVSSHGFSQNQLILWKYPSMTKIQEFKAHTARVLAMDMSPDGQIVSAGADETLRFWDIFGPPPIRRSSKSGLGSFGDLQVGITTVR